MAQRTYAAQITALPILLALNSCVASPVVVPSTQTEPIENTAGSIGVATQEADGTIVLQLRATGSGMTGDSLIRYAPTNPHYAKIRDHVGPIPPGGSVPVKPFD